MYRIDLLIPENGDIVTYVIDNNDLDDHEHKTISPQLEMEENSFGSLALTIPAKNIYYHKFDTTSTSSIFNAEVHVVATDVSPNEIIFRGRLLDIKRDIKLNRQVTFEGELSYLADTVQEPAEYKEITPRAYIESLISIHNRKCEPRKRFKIGDVTVNDDSSTDHITGRVHHGSYTTDYGGTTWSYLQNLLSELGGFFRVRWVDGERYLDYLSEHTSHSGQSIDFGTNLLDYAEEWSLAELYTVVVPTGATLTTKDTNGNSISYTVTIASVNDDGVYLKAPQAIINRYGRRERQIQFSGIADPSHLKSIAALYLNNTQFDNMVLSLTALDMYELNPEITQSKLHFQSIVTVNADLFDVNGRDMPITKISLPLKDPARAVYSMSTNTRGVRSLSDKITDMADEVSNAVDDTLEDVEDMFEVNQETAAQASMPDDWIFGIPEIVFPNDELERTLLYHSSYITRAWDCGADGLKDLIKLSFTFPSTSNNQELICELPELVSERTGQNLRITHGKDTLSSWADVEVDSTVNEMNFIKGTHGRINVETNASGALESGCRVLYLVVRFDGDTEGTIGFTDTSSYKWAFGSNDGMLCEFQTNSKVAITANVLGVSSGSANISTNDYEGNPSVIVLAFAHGIKETERFPISPSLLIGANMYEANNLISAVRYPPAMTSLLATHTGIDINYKQPFSDNGYVNDGQTPSSSDPDHSVTLLRAVECFSNVYGVITADEVVENVAWLAGRFVSKVFNNDGAEFPKDGILPSNQEEDDQEDEEGGDD